MAKRSTKRYKRAKTRKRVAPVDAFAVIAMVNTAERNRIVTVLIPEALHQLRTAVVDLERLCQDHDTDNGYIAEAYSKIADLLVSLASPARFNRRRDG